ncbi:MAG: hypothetical protein MJ168_06365 [Clostridia bacterium]|nr:hypothetical protein [Clostridia bacterium]
MKNICMIAHRGYSGKYLGNTEQAFLKAVDNKSGGAETDIRMTKDGVLVCNHNETAVFKDGSELEIASHTFAELTAQPLMNNKTDDDVYICPLRRYLEIMRDNNMICFVELKGEFTDGQIADVFNLVGEVYDLSKCILQSFDFDNLVKIHKQIPDLPVMYTYGKSERNYERCFDYGFSIDVDQYVVTEKMIAEFHERNLEIGVWTVNEADRLEYIRSLGVDYIESDVFGG